MAPLPERSTILISLRAILPIPLPLSRYIADLRIPFSFQCFLRRYLAGLFQRLSVSRSQTGKNGHGLCFGGSSLIQFSILSPPGELSFSGRLTSGWNSRIFLSSILYIPYPFSFFLLWP